MWPAQLSKCTFQTKFKGISSSPVFFEARISFFFSCRNSIFMSFPNCQELLILAAWCNYSQSVWMDNLWKSAHSVYPQPRNNGFCSWLQKWKAYLLWRCVLLYSCREENSYFSFFYLNVSENKILIKMHRNLTITSMKSSRVFQENVTRDWKCV